MQIPVLLPFEDKVIFQNKHGQPISSDTEYFVKEILKSSSKMALQVLDLGCGIGIIAIMLKYYRPEWNILGMDIQSDLINLSQENAERIELDISFLEGDLRFPPSIISKKKFELIVSNPPFYLVTEGKISPFLERAISRHELKCNMDNVVSFFSKHLSLHGKGFLIYPQTRFSECEHLVNLYDLKILRKIDVEFGKPQKRKFMVEISRC